MAVRQLLYPATCMTQHGRKESSCRNVAVVNIHRSGAAVRPNQ